MNKIFSVSKYVVVPLFFISLSLASSLATAKDEVGCRMNFTMKSWSFFYKSGKGTGDISCNNGQKAHVKLRGQGGGITFGKSKIIDGLGVFSDVGDINELFGNYAAAEAHAGVVESGSARALTKGEVSLTLTGAGKGVDIGINFGNFKISRN